MLVNANAVSKRCFGKQSHSHRKSNERTMKKNKSRQHSAVDMKRFNEKKSKRQCIGDVTFSGTTSKPQSAHCWIAAALQVHGALRPRDTHRRIGQICPFDGASADPIPNYPFHNRCASSTKPRCCLLRDRRRCGRRRRHYDSFVRCHYKFIKNLSTVFCSSIDRFT